MASNKHNFKKLTKKAKSSQYKPRLQKGDVDLGSPNFVTGDGCPKGDDKPQVQAKFYRPACHGRLFSKKNQQAKRLLGQNKVTFVLP